jgi:uncharacterized phage infection (PIP) family protein YhgE
MTNYSKTSTANWLLGTVKRNPEGLLLLAAGCALVLRSTRSTERPQHSDTYRDLPEYQRQHRANIAGNDVSHQRGTTDWAEGASRVADNAREYASSVGKAVSETAANYAAAVTEYADGTRQKAVKQSRRLADQAQSSMQSLVQEQPLAVALAGLAAGVAVAAAFPATTWERRTLGPAGQRLSEAAETAREKISETTSAAGERLKSAAQERGLSAEGLKEVAREVAGGITGEPKPQHSSEAGRTASGTSGPQRSAGSNRLSGGTQSGTASLSTADPNRSGTNK